MSKLTEKSKEMEEVFFLVEWVGENKYSCVRRSDLCDGVSKTLSGDKLIGTEADFLWGKKVYKGYIYNHGSEADMQSEADLFAEETAARLNRETLCANKEAKPRKKKCIKTLRVATANLTKANAIDNLMQVVNNQDESSNENIIVPDQEEDNQIQDLENAIAKLENRKKYWKELARKRKIEIIDLKKKIGKNDSAEGTTVIGGNISVCKIKLNAVKTLSNSPTSYARNLMRVLFIQEELVGKSLFGQSCNANKSSEARPCIDPERRDAIILHTMSVYGHKLDNVRQKKIPMMRDVKRSMGDYLREVTAAHAKLIGEDSMELQ